MVLNRSGSRILSSIAFETVKSQTEEKQKGKISGKPLEIGFWYQP